MSTPQQPSNPQRRIDLDWVRILAFALLIFYHVGMLYVSWGFHIKSEHRLTWLEPVMLVLNPWRLSLLFLVSGVASRFMLGKVRLGTFARTRSVRLLVPLMTGMLVIVPPQSYLQIVETLGYPAGFVDYYVRHYLAFSAQFCPSPCIVQPTWNHLWFVVYLWVYTMALAGVLCLWPTAADWIGERLATMLASPWLLVGPCLLFSAWRLFLAPIFPSTHALFGDWYNHADYASAFLIGFLLARQNGIWRDLERQRWVALMLAAICFAVFVLVYAGVFPRSPMLRWIAGAAYGCYQWIAMATVLGFARRHLTADGPVRRYLTDAIFPFYIVHQTAIIVIAHALRDSGLSAAGEATIVIAGTALTCLVSYEIARRIGWLRPLFGLRLEPRSVGGIARQQPV
ncbi:acyltransferase family protein [Bradyrhizobium sp. INPA01-394B]|uniref:Acyltransferase family protein n=1 Tax=Bradyrhizobium campsiandrae TaxID=1729892 RepID=A0ABR7U7Y7_9BRAD|nr:acyltransferase family protein [Bradyrhizobium campsiandrae]MBC9875999.1 acyltransferase family protein [Bradyrhizobium campsiandrae]MBC9979542.1 acyltransferase family protein [Bradyrhizobium campsiandrae]